MKLIQYNPRTGYSQSYLRHEAMRQSSNHKPIIECSSIRCLNIKTKIITMAIQKKGKYF